MSLINLEPIYSKREEEELNLYDNNNFSTLYKEKDEGELYDIAKTLRKRNQLSYAPKLKQNNPDTYKDLIVNKPKLNSPAGEVLNTYGAGSLAQPSAKLPSKEEKLTTKEIITGFYENDIKTVTGKVLGGIATGLEKADDTIFKKGVAGTSALAGAVYFNAEELKNSIKEDRSFDFLKAGEKFEDYKERIEYLWGTKLEADDYLEFKTAGEKRKDIYNSSDLTTQKDLDNISDYTIVADLTAGLTTGILTGGVGKALVTKYGTSTTTGKIINALDKTVNPSITNMAKLGAGVGAIALPYYGLTGKWLWEGDEKATEGALIPLASLGLKGLSKTPSAVKSVFNDKQFQDGLQNFFDNYSRFTGARTTLLPDGKDLKGLTPNSKATKATKEIEIDPIKKEKRKTIVQNKILRDIERATGKPKAKERWIEKRARDLGYWNDKKSYLSNVFNFSYNRLQSKFVKNQYKVLGRQLGDKRVNWKLEKADKTVQEKLYMQQTFGKIDNFNKEFEDISKIIGDKDFAEFNHYLWSKSRWAKTVAEESKGNQLKTVQLLEDGSTSEWAKADLEEAWKLNDSKYSRIAERVNNLNKQVLELELEAGIRSQDEVDNFLKSNPYYIPDKLELDNIDGFIKDGDFSIKNVKGKKELKGGSETSEFSINSLENLAKSIGYRTRLASQSKLYNEMLNISEIGKYGIVKEVKKGDVARRGYSTVSFYKDGERKLVEVPTYFKELVDSENRYALGTISNILSTPTKILKFFATGPLNLAFQLKAPIWEVQLGLFKNWANQGSTIDYLKSLLRTGSYMNTPEGKIAIRGLLKNYGGDFSGIKQFDKEMENFVNIDNKTFKKNSKSLIKKGYKGVESIGHNVELRTTRIPLFEAQLKKSGLSNKQFQSIVKNNMVGGQVDINKLSKELTSKGVDLEKAGYVARSLFDYNIASSKINAISKFIPYLNITVSSVSSLKSLFDEAPRKFLTYTAGMIGLAEIMYEFNYGEGIFKNRKEEGSVLRNQNAYVRNKVGLYFPNIETSKLDLLDIGHNWQVLEWVYPMVVNMRENQSINPGLEGVNRIFKDFTYLGDFTKKGFVDLSKLPPVVRQGLEYTLNKDLFYDKDLIPQWKQNIYPTDQYDKYTNPLYIKTAKTLALLTGGTPTPDGLIEGGYQISPKNLEKGLEIFDPLGKVGDTLAISVNKLENIGVTESNVKEFKKSFFKTYKLLEEKVEYSDLDIKENALKVSIRDTIKQSLSNIKDVDLLKEETRRLLDIYGDYDSVLAKEYAFARNTLLFGKSWAIKGQRTAKEWGVSLEKIYRIEGKEAYNNEINSLSEKVKYFSLSEGKIQEIKEEVNKRIKGEVSYEAIRVKHGSEWADKLEYSQAEWQQYFVKLYEDKGRDDFIVDYNYLVNNYKSLGLSIEETESILLPIKRYLKKKGIKLEE